MADDLTSGSQCPMEYPTYDGSTSILKYPLSPHEAPHELAQIQYGPSESSPYPISSTACPPRILSVDTLLKTPDLYYMNDDGTLNERCIGPSATSCDLIYSSFFPASEAITSIDPSLQWS